MDSIDEWNKTWARNLGIRLEVIRWEDDAYPGIGADAQDVINQQLPQDYDLFIGIMWTRFGTPTLRAESGTAEEFARAVDAHRSAPGNTEIFFYFKDTPISPSKLDVDQHTKVQTFKRSLKDEGVFYWDFADIEQFEKLVTLHITRHVQSWRHRHHAKPAHVSTASISTSTDLVSAPLSSSAPDDEDEGLLDLVEAFEERIADVTQILERLTEAQTELSSKTTQGTAELLELQNTPEGISAKHARRAVAKVADEMLRFTARTEAEIPLFRAAMNSSMAALTKAATLSVDFDTGHTQSARLGAMTLLASLPAARQSMISFKATTLALPRITKELNQAKRRQAAALDNLITEFENAERLITEAISVIDTLLAGGGAAQPPNDT